MLYGVGDLTLEFNSPTYGLVYLPPCKAAFSFRIQTDARVAQYLLENCLA